MSSPWDSYRAPKQRYAQTEWESGTGFRIERPAWTKQANCKDEPTTTFYPAPGDVEKLRRAKSICKECVVRHDCLESALESSERFGIWGGKSARERSLILRAQRLLNSGSSKHFQEDEGDSEVTS
jgi:WhiB family redox-sensing transcriptional regulator